MEDFESIYEDAFGSRTQQVCRNCGVSFGTEFAKVHEEKCKKETDKEHKKAVRLAKLKDNLDLLK